ncbi:MAG TPA: metallophosphoesterase family protein [Tenuifilaceae bacterium]|nr:metallophosphoesterase family protein [Tenuifilaceae bacterium]HQB78854.1 metallophosphoesterase family protein [Tenuifilaceae bacterium]
MNILVISDLHIDNGDNFGTFDWKPKRFIKTLEKIVEEYKIEQVILNGDVFDLYKYTFKDIYHKNFELISYFNRKGYIYIRGNHDLLNPFAKDSHLIVNSLGQSIYIEHGHNADFLNGTSIGRFIGRVSFALFEKLVKIPRFERWYFRVVEWDDEVNRIPKKYNTYKYLKYALKLLRSYDMVILGHTHKLESHKTYYLNSKKWYLNTGTCSLGRFQAVVVDTETLKHESIKIGKKENIKKNTESEDFLPFVSFSA